MDARTGSGCFSMEVTSDVCVLQGGRLLAPAVVKQMNNPLRLKDKPCFVAWPGFSHMGDSLGRAVTLLPQ